ncbi:MAG: sulfotransferase family protein [Alphaproteobacteria bacterium]|nr:MAG: sulfotransferase family protein [Alphaproteobacteria bacterium]
MNRRDRKARGIKGKKGDQAIVHNAIALARQLEEKKQHTEAIKLYEKILQYDPDNIIALFDLAVDDLEHGRIERAEQKLSNILRQDPRHGGALACLGTIRLDQGRREESMRLAEKSLQTNPNHGVLVQLSVLYRNAGLLEKAKDLIYRALKLHPDDIRIWYTLQSLDKYNAEDLPLLSEIEKGGNFSLPQKIILKFTLGKACMDTGQPEKAFWHYAEANLLKRATYKFDIAATEAYFTSITKLFTKETVQRLRGKCTIKSDRPIFIVGLPRSGSTLVDQILSSHPDVGSVGEARFLGKSIPAFPNEEVPGYIQEGAPSITQKLMDNMNGAMLDDIAATYLRFLDQDSNAKRVVDKMLFNFAWLGVIRLAFPEAKIIHCVRDPVDIGLSIWQILFTDLIPWAYDQKEIGRYYLAYRNLMTHWRKLFPGEFYDIRYEDLVADQEGQSRKLLEFCNLPWDDRVLKFHETTRQVKTASVTQVRQPIYKDSVKKWKKYEKHLKTMIDTIGLTE